MLFYRFLRQFPLSGYPVNVYYCLCLLALLPLLSPAASPAAIEPDLNELVVSVAVTRDDTPFAAICRSFNELNTRIRDGRIVENDARSELQRLLTQVREEYFRSNRQGFQRPEWVFPLSGYDARAVGRGRRHGYIARGYDFFSGNRHGGHPSYDIFIRDRKQVSLDSRSGKPVKVLSLTGGVVVALEKGWEQGSRLRGGKYVWVYDPGNDLLVYYAHNSELAVELGDVVKPGDVLATVGRSGWNAAKKRSPTHLHLTVLKVREGRVEPLKLYRELSRARTAMVL